MKEFDSIYCFNLRGNQRTKGELSKKEGGKVFGGSSRTPIAITFLVKNPERRNQQAKIKYHDIGDYLNREEKLEKIKSFHCIKGMEEKKKWKVIATDKYGDWINQRDDFFYQFMPMGDKKSGNQNAIFSLYAHGVATSRDSWVYNFNKNQVKKNSENMIQFYNQELNRLKNKELNSKNIDQYISLDEKKISWSRSLKADFVRKREGKFKRMHIRKSSYRPFMKSCIYFDRMFNEVQSQLQRIFPKEDMRNRNKVICVSGVGANTFSVLMTDTIPNGDYMPKGQCFPLYRFDDKTGDPQQSLIDENNCSYSIADSTLNRFKLHYKNLAKQKSPTNNIVQKIQISITKEDIFYYIYGLLHSEDYREKYKSNLDKDLPRIPLVPEFWEFSSNGRDLADLHLNYENQLPPEEIKILKDEKELKNLRFLKPINKEAGKSSLQNTGNWHLPKELNPNHLKVKKMKYYKSDKSKIQFNKHIAITNIPEKAWEYKINGWSALKWIVERYQYKQDKKTELINDPNTYSEDSAYILKLLLSVITVSLKTQELVQSLPSIDFDKLIASTDKAS